MENFTIPYIPTNVSNNMITYIVEINRYNIDLNKILDIMPVARTSKFVNCVACKFDKHSFKLFTTGKVHISGPYDPYVIGKIINSILRHIDGAKINQITATYICFEINNLDMNKVKTHLDECPDVDKYNDLYENRYKWNKSLVWIENNKVIVNSRYQNFMEIYNLIMRSQFSWYNPFSWWY